MYAVIKTGSKQYRVKQGDLIDIELLKGLTSKEVTFQDVLLVNNGNAVKVGSPLVAGASVKGEVVSEVKDKKLVVFKYKRRKNSRVKNGHRQRLTRVKITEVVGG